MTISADKIYPRTGDTQTVYLKNVITDAWDNKGDIARNISAIQAGDVRQMHERLQSREK